MTAESAADRHFEQTAASQGDADRVVVDECASKEDLEKLPAPSIASTPADVFIEGGENHDGIKAVVGGWCVW